MVTSDPAWQVLHLTYAPCFQLESIFVSFSACQPAVSHSMSAMNAKASSGGEEEALGIRSKTLGESSCLGEVKRERAILAAYLIATLELTFLFMQMGVMPYLAKSLGLDSVGFGYLQTTFGVLQLVGGPIFGSIFVPVYVGLVGNLINIMITMIWIPLQSKPKSDHHVMEHRTSQTGSVFSIREILCLMKLPGVMEVFIVKVFAGLPVGLFLIMFSIISMDFFGLEAVESGYLMSYFGVLQMVVQGLVVGRLTNSCTERTLLRLSIFVFASVGLGMALMRTVWHYCIIVVPLVFAFSMLGTITDSILTNTVPSSDTGTMLGLCASVQPLTRTVGPTIGGFLYRQFGVSSFGYLQLIVNIGLFVYLLKSKIPLKVMKSQ
ncbi:solute carrier family 22 member 18 isoform X3 [Phalacrocorax carbo]|uniref:solute carrier family 22 member 18 isoform X3 n=1 Tax=Phalacrocorax carbo TaxID=9209 RepID=UPI00311A3308